MNLKLLETGINCGQYLNFRLNIYLSLIQKVILVWDSRVVKMTGVLQIHMHLIIRSWKLCQSWKNVHVRIVYLYGGQTSELHHLYSQITLLIQEPLFLCYALLHFHSFHSCQWILKYTNNYLWNIYYYEIYILPIYTYHIISSHFDTLGGPAILT